MQILKQNDDIIDDDGKIIYGDGSLGSNIFDIL